MNQENFEYLKEQLKYSGFGEGLHRALEVALNKKEPQFQLTFEKDINGKAFVALLNFRKSDQTDRYFFNSYHASLQRSNGEILDQAFYLQNGKGVTAKEAYNLLDGRSVYKELQNKEGQPYQAWLQLDFDKRDKHNNHEVRQYHEAYGYDLKAALSRYTISEMDGGDREKQLLQSLQKGNMQSVSMEKEGTVAMVVVEASPQFKSVNVYSPDLKKLPKEHLEQFQQVTPSGLNKSEVNKGQDKTQGQSNKMEMGPGQEEKGKKPLKEGKDLLPKRNPSKTQKGTRIQSS